MRYPTLLFIAIWTFSSCTKEINLNLADKSGTIVIEGNITNQPGPYLVKVSKSVPFSEENIYPTIDDALVIISDNTGIKDTLQFVGDGLYQTNKIQGAVGNTYELTVIAEGNTYTAKSTMPTAVSLTDLSIDSIKFGNSINYTLFPQFIDPIELGNRYLFMITTVGKEEKIFEVFSDNINNGLANQRSILLTFNNTNTDITIEKGDRLIVEMQSISQEIFTFYNALIDLSEGGANGGITPANPVNNLNNNALGYFSAHGSSTRTITID